MALEQDPHPSRRGNEALRRGRVSLGGHAYHVTSTTQFREPIFSDFATARAAVRNLNDVRVLRTSELLAWVLMPDHLHVLLQLGEDETLSSLVNRVKTVTSRAVNKHRGLRRPVWQRAFHDHLVRSDENMRAVARYIVLNPVRAGLVDRVSMYPHWDAVWV